MRVSGEAPAGMARNLTRIPVGRVVELRFELTRVHWQHRQSLLIQDQFVPDAGPGTYAFRSRIRNVRNGTHSRFVREAP